MSPARQALRLARRLTRWALQVVTAAAAVWFLVALAGSWVAAGVLGLAVTVGAVALWARCVEPWLFASRFPPGEDFVVRLVPPPGVEVDHVAFARALSAVADAYLDECVRQAAGEIDEDGFL